jgi:hypothetical protein
LKVSRTALKARRTRHCHRNNGTANRRRSLDPSKRQFTPRSLRSSYLDPGKCDRHRILLLKRCLPWSDTPAITALLYFLALPLKTRRTSSSTIYSTTIPRTLPRTTSNRPCLRSRTGSLSSRSRPTPPCVLASREYLILSGGALGALLGAYDNIQQFYCGALL